MSCGQAPPVALRHDRHRSERAGVAGAPDPQRSVEHQPAADERADKEVEEVAVPPASAEEELGRAGGGRVVAERDRIRSRSRRFPARRRNRATPAMAPDGAPISASQVHSWNGEATPRPAIRRLCASLSASVERRQRGADELEDHLRGRDRRRCAARARRTAPRKSISTRSQLRRPILSPREKAPSGSSDIGTVGCPTRPRSGASRFSSPSACSRFMIAEVDCTDSPVSLATSIFDSGPNRRTRDSRSRSL